MDNNKILNDSFVKINNYIQRDIFEQDKVVDFQTPYELKNIFNIKITETGVSETEFLELLDKYLQYSVNTGNKQFLNQLYSGFNFPAFIGEVFSVLANTSMYTYEVAPVATTIETEMIDLMNSYTGFTEGDGIFVSGGSNANLIAMLSARNRILPESRSQGYDRSNKLVAFINEHAHYSFETAANVLGIGADNVIKVKADKGGRLIAKELEKEIVAAIERNEKPFFVSATCATTLLGAYDPIDEMAPICKKYNLWLHADGSFGGSVIISDKYRHLMNGIEETDSFAWNPHKLMNIPLICSAILVKNRGTLHYNITDINADYIFHDIDAIEDLGEKSIQCGRKVDAVKLWFAWKYYGKKGYQKRIDNLIEQAKYAEEFVINHPKLELLSKRQSFTICFRYIPNIETDINSFNLDIRESLRKSGKSIVNYGYINEILAIRLVTANGELTQSDIDLFFNNFIDEGYLMEDHLEKLKAKRELTLYQE